LARGGEFSEGTAIIAMYPIKIFRAREVRCTCIRTKANCRLNGCLPLRPAVQEYVQPKEVKRVMSVGELAVSLEKRWVTPDGFVQQVSCRQQSRSCGTAKACQKKIFGLSIELEGGDIARRGTFDCTLFTGREFRLKLVGNRLCDLTLNREYVCKIAVIGSSPFGERNSSFPVTESNSPESGFPR
jgi:hypothetical protein